MNKLRLIDDLVYFLKQQEGIVVERNEDLIITARGQGLPRFLDLSSDDQVSVGINNMANYSDGDSMVLVGMERFLDLLTKKIEIHRHFKGRWIHRVEYRVIEESEESYHFGFAIYFWVPFWKKNIVESEVEQPLLARVIAENAFAEILARFG